MLSFFLNADRLQPAHRNLSRFTLTGKARHLAALMLLGLTAHAFTWPHTFTHGAKESSVRFERTGSQDWKLEGSGYVAAVSSDGVSIPLPKTTLHLSIGATGNSSGIELQPSEEFGQYQQLFFSGVWPGVDAVYHGDGGNLEFDYLLKPGTNPKAIHVVWTGQDNLRLQPSGNLLLHAGRAEVSVLRPKAWQERNGQRTNVDVSYKLDGTAVGFELGSYDHSLAVRIDPVILVKLPVETKQVVEDGRAAHAVAAGADGSLYLAGSDHAWVSRSNPTSGEELFHTNLGSGARDLVEAMAVTSQGNAHVAGTVFVNNIAQGFVAELDAAGDRISYAALPSPVKALALGTSGEVYLAGDTFVTRQGGWKVVPPGPVNALAVDASGHVYAAGRISGAAYVARLTEQGTRWDWVLPLGGSGSLNEARALAASRDGSIYIAGLTNSPNFPVKSAFEDRLTGVQDAFLARVNPDGSGTVWATYFGGHGSTAAAALSLDPAGQPLLAGVTDVRDLPMAEAGTGHEDGFFARFDPAGKLIESAYLQSPVSGRLLAVASDLRGQVYVAGSSTQAAEEVVAAQVTLNGIGVLASTGAAPVRESADVAGVTARLGSPTTTTVMAAANPSTFGAPTTLTATVSPSTATGDVTFYDGATFLGVSTLSSGTATLSTIALPSTISSLKATYIGNVSFAPSTSTPVSQTVNAVAGISFAPPSGSPYAAGTMPAAVAVGDFNGDGKADMAITNYGGNNVTVLLGNGAGSFTPATGSPFAVGTNPVDVAVGDFNDDGLQDLVVSNFNDNTITVLLGNGTGGFTPATGSPFGVGSGPRALAVGDFNGDGQADIAVGNYGSNSLTILLGNGTAGFTQATGSPIGVGTNPYSIALGDFNGDGITDLAVANQGSNNVTVLLGSGSGSFAPATGSPFAVGNHPNSVTVADFNGDGKLDLAVANYADNTVTVLLGNGSASFTASSGSPFSAMSGPYSLTTGDFNGDGILDIAVADAITGEVTTLIGSGNGNFTAETGSPFAAGTTSLSIAAGDFNGDGRVDVAVANLGSNNVTVLLGTGAATHLAIVQQPTTGMAGSFIGNVVVQVEDSGGSVVTGSSAVISINSSPAGVGGAVTQSATNGVATFSGLVFSAPNTYTLTASSAGLMSATSTPISITAGAPTKLVITSQPTSGTVNVPIGNVVVQVEDANGDLVTTSTATITITSSPTGVGGTTSMVASGGIATFNNLIFTAGNLYTLTAASTGLSSAISNSILIGGTASKLAITSQPTTGVTGSPIGNVVVTVEDSNGNPVSGSTATVNITSSPTGVGGTTSVNAVNGLATFSNLMFTTAGSFKLTASSTGLTSATSNSIVISFASSTVEMAQPNPSVFGSPVTLTATVSPSSSTGVVTFFNGQTLVGDATLVSGTATLSTIALPAGKLSLTAFYVGNSNHAASRSAVVSQTVNAVLSSGFTPAPGSPVTVGTNPAGVAIGDFNGDGIADMAITNFGDNTVSVMLGNGSGGFTAATGSPFATGKSPVGVVVGDFNDDGKLDLAVANSATNTVTVLLGNGSGGFTADTGSPFAAGNSPRALVVGDFNGDGKADLAIADFANASVTVLLGNGAGAFSAATGSPFAVGNNPFSITISDFNNDGIADLAVANQSDNTVTVLLGSGTGTFSPAGNAITVGNHPNAVLAADFNGDGNADFAVANYQDNTVSIFLGAGNGTFTSASGSPFAVVTGPYSLAMGDFNGDGVIDIAVADGISGDLTVLLGSGNGNFTEETGSPFNAGTSPLSIGVADFNGDGRADLAAANLGSNNVTILLGTPGAGLASKLVITSQPSTGTAATAIGNVVVQIEDINGNLVTGSTAAVTITSSPTGVSGTLGVNAIAGVATFSTLMFNTTGAYTVTAASTGLSSATSSPITIAAGPATKLIITSQPTTGSTGTAIGNVVVQVEDANGNLVTTSSAPVSIASTPTGVSGTTTVNATNGVATFGALTFSASGSYILTASSTGLTSATSTAITISGTATKLVITSQPSTGAAGTAIGNVVVTVEDANGNTVTTSTAAIAITSSPSGVTGITSMNATNGVATFNNLIFNTAGSYMVTAASTGLTSATSSTITITGGTATKLAITAPTTGNAGTPIGNVVVQVEDVNGNLVTTSTAAITISSSPGGVSGTLAMNASGGIATFTNLTFPSAGTFTLKAASTGLTSATSSSIVIGAAATKLVITSQPTTGTTGTAIGNVVVQVETASGQVVTGSTALITIVSSPGGVTGTLSMHAANGVATFNNLIFNTAGTFKVKASSSGLTDSVSKNIVISGGGTATKLAITTQPTTGTAGSPIGNIVVNVETASGAVVTTSTAAVTLSSLPAGAMGSLTVNAVNGVATFTGITFDVATRYTLTVTSPGLTSASGPTLTVQSATASKLDITQRASSGTAGTPLSAFHVQVQDQFGNVVTTSTAAMTMAVTTGPGSFTSGSTTTVNAVMGIASFTNLQLNTAGTYTLTVSSPGLTSETTPSFMVAPGPASALVFTTEPVNGAVNTKLATIRVSIEDAFGNVVKTSTASVTVAANGPGSFTSGSTTTVSAVSGVATFSNLTLATSGSYTITASSTGLSNGTSTSFMVN